MLRIESASRPDFLRVMALGPKNPHGLEGSPLYDALNVGKRNATFNLKDPRAVDFVTQADGRVGRRRGRELRAARDEGFRPRLRVARSEHADDLVMISACLNGQTGPHKDYPGFGSQGSALSGFTYLTGWPDREPDRPVRHHHRLPGAALRRGRRGRGPALPPPHRSWRLPRPLAGGGGHLHAVAVAPRSRRRRHDRGVATATGPHARCRTACSRAPTKANGRAHRPLGRDRVLDRRRVGHAGRGDRRRRPGARQARRAPRPHRRGRGRRQRVDSRPERLEVAERLQSARDRGCARGGLRRHPRRSAGRAP